MFAGKIGNGLKWLLRQGSSKETDPNSDKIRCLKFQSGTLGFNGSFTPWNKTASLPSGIPSRSGNWTKSSDASSRYADFSVPEKQTAPFKLRVIGWCTTFEKSCIFTIAQWSFTTSPVQGEKKQNNVLRETSKFAIFATLAKMLILQLFVRDVLESLLIFFPFGQFNVYLNAPFHYWPGPLPSSSLLTADLCWLCCGGGWLLVIQTCLWLISVSN